MRSFEDIPIVENIPVLVRGALNVPLENGRVVNDYRLRRALPTLEHLAKKGARIVLIGHIGEEGTETLLPVAEALGTLLPNVSFSPDTLGPRVTTAIHALSPGQVLVLENLRRDRGEVENNLEFARALASLADVFVQDSFDVCHRPHASVVSIPKFLPSYAGLLLEEEAAELSRALKPQRPAFAVIGGAKFSTKEPVLSALLGRYDHVFVGGALANDFLKASGQAVGESYVSLADRREVARLLENRKLVVPIDSRVIPKKHFGDPDAHSYERVAGPGEVRSDEIILDHGPGTETLLVNLVAQAKTILWNGPLGHYETGFVETTNTLARAIGASSAHSVVGGGDTVAAIEKLGLLSKFSFVSTGGGAMLDFLASGTLPGLVALG